MESNEINVLRKIVENLNPVDIKGTEYAPKFDFGSELDTVIMLERNRRNKANIYPLVWLETPYDVEVNDHNQGTTTTNLIIATLSNSSKTNQERLDTSFELVLLPVLRSLLKALKGKYTSFDEYKKTYYFNFQVERDQTEIWDAIRLEIELKFKNCII